VSAEMIGFQSLLYANAYAPQTATVRGEKMFYTMTPVFGTIDCVRVSEKEADAELAKIAN